MEVKYDKIMLDLSLFVCILKSEHFVSIIEIRQNILSNSCIKIPYLY